MSGEHAHDLEGLLEALDSIDQEQVTLGDMLQAAGGRSFGPLLVVIGLVIVSPLGGIPGMATAGGAISLLASVQLLLGRRHFWLPGWLLRRSVRADRFHGGLRRLRRPAGWIDRLLRPRLRPMLHAPWIQITATAAVLVGFVMPLLEMVPFADVAPGVALLLFGLALISQDGALALIALLLFGVTFGLAATAALG